MKKVAIIRVYNVTNYGHEDYSETINVIQNISDWEEMEDEAVMELRDALRHAATREYQFHIVEQMDSIFAQRTIQDYRKFLKTQEEKRLKEEAEYMRRQFEAKQKREAKKLEKIIKDRERLKKMAADMGLTLIDTSAQVSNT